MTASATDHRVARERRPIRMTAAATTATTAGLSPLKPASTSGRCPAATYSELRARSVRKPGTTNSPPAVSAPFSPCWSQPR